MTPEGQQWKKRLTKRKSSNTSKLIYSTNEKKTKSVKKIKRQGSEGSSEIEMCIWPVPTLLRPPVWDDDAENVLATSSSVIVIDMGLVERFKGIPLSESPGRDLF